jgi:tRNA (guanine37-N1)-methyltransferase
LNFRDAAANISKMQLVLNIFKLFFVLLHFNSSTMQIDIVTVLPQLLESPFSHSILKRAEQKGLVKVNIINLRDYATNKHKNVDDYSYGGDAGMVMMVEPIVNCLEALQSERKYDEIIYMSPDGDF